MGVTQSFRPSRLLLLLAGIKFLILLDFMVLMPLAPALGRDLGVSAAGFGRVVSAYTGASALVAFFGSRLFLRFSPRSLLLACLALFSLMTLGGALAVGEATLLCSRIGAGSAAGLLWASCLALVMDHYPEQERGRALGVIMGAYSLSAVLGVPLGLFLSDWGSFRAPLTVIGGLGLVLLALCLRRVPSFNPPPLNAGGEAVRGPAVPFLFKRLLLTLSVVSTGFLLIPYLSLFMVEELGLSSYELAGVYFLGGACSFFTNQVVGVGVDRFGPVRSLIVAIVLAVIPHQLFFRQNNPSWTSVGCFFVLFMVLTSARMIPTLGVVTRGLSPRVRGRFMAQNTAMSDLGCTLGAWGGSLTLGQGSSGGASGWTGLSTLASLFALLSLALLFWIHLDEKKVNFAPTWARQGSRS